ncbi:MAG: PAS domain-containing protein, partial [Sphingomonadaceae bacterium]
MAIGNIFSKRRESDQSGEQLGEQSVIGMSDMRRLKLLDDFETANLGWFWATDTDGKLIYLSENAAKQFGRDVSEVLGRPLSELFILDRDNE